MIGGLDLSTKALDFVIVDPDDVTRCEHRRVELPSPWWGAARGMRGVMEHLEHREIDDYPWIDFWQFYGIELLAIERPYGPSRQAIASLHTILGAVLATIPPSITCLEIRPAEMRQALGLKGNVSKEIMHAHIAMMRIGMKAREWPPDALDAWAAANAALWLTQKALDREKAA